MILQYNDSAKKKNKMRSLNEWLNLGSITLEDRCTLLLCVRTKTIGIIAVIEKKFL